MDGFEVFMRNVPPDLTDQSLKTQLTPFLTIKLGIIDWACQKHRGRPSGSITFLYRADGERFLKAHGEHRMPGVTRNGRPRSQARLSFLGANIFCTQSDKKPDVFLLRALVKAVEDRNHKDEDEEEPQKSNAVVFDLQELSCGHYEYPMGFFTYTADIKWTTGGIAKFARNSLVVNFKSRGGSIRMEIPYRAIYDVIVCERPPSLVLTLYEAPRLFSIHSQTCHLGQMMSGMGISRTSRTSNETTRSRINEIPHEKSSHGEIIGQSLVYCLSISPIDFHLKVTELKNKDHLSFSSYNFPTIPTGQTSMITGLKEFANTLKNSSTKMPFDILFQFEALVKNGYLLPQTVEKLIARFLREMRTPTNGTATSFGNRDNEHGPQNYYYPISANAVKKLFSIAFPGPDIEPSTFDPDSLWDYLENNEREIRRGLTKELISERGRQNLTMVYKVQVTPSRILLLGPEPEAKNRILRKFPQHTGFFARVQFCDEDGQDLYLTAKVSLDKVYERFKSILLRGVPIAGRQYMFLGFSHSSLRAHAVWFMATFVDHKGNMQTYFSVISDLGEFKNITSPARCAARIGQAFSETPFSTNLDGLGVKVKYIPDVKSTDQARIFSDGVGTISRDLMYAIHDGLPPKWRSATCFQIRWAGAKGMLSLDDRLEGLQMCIRQETMVKFESNDRQNLEICDVANKPIPLVLNRQLIKILEDMKVPERWFLKLQNRELSRLRKITAHTDNTVIFLKRQKVADQVRFSQFIRRLHKLGIDYRKDSFLCSVVETTVLREVRLLKHKARIPVEKGVTLFGVMDEFNYLGEDEVFITFDKLRGTHYIDLHNQPVIVTRSPALHPGDVQIKRAVVPPRGHYLRELSNCIVFSQKGTRDLPSQLSGGDLDGDTYHIIWDSDAVRADLLDFEPADYPRVPPLNIGRTVKREDMTEFFVKFMATDQLGTIAVKHMILADMHHAGTVSDECKKLAEMHSTGVDYSKTGVPVDMAQLRSLSRTVARPDFLAPAPPANIVDLTEIAFEAPVAPSMNEDEDDYTGPSYRFYRSVKALGKLYRAIDEKRIWKNDIHKTISRVGPSVWEEVIAYIDRTCERLGSINWQKALEEAHSIRQAYDDAIWIATISHSDHSYARITELEVFTGSIFNKSGIQTRRQRDKSVRLKDEFDRISKWVQALIHKREMKAFDDEEDDKDDDEDDYDGVGQTSSSLELSIACLHAGIAKPSVFGASSQSSVEFQSFKVVAASCALRELEYAIKKDEIAVGAAIMGGGFPGVSAGRWNR
ncbi:rna-dependent rna polymerase [Biscogniauxia mediterranea]|nr:rna-dependent rna polymerase [Biscogniauxia mediterranea]